MKIMRYGIFAALFVMMISVAAFGQILQWNTFGNVGTETSEPSILNDANISSTNLTQGTITAAANGNRFGGSGWFNSGNTAAGNTLAEAIAGNDYIQFIITPNSGYSFTPTSFVFNWDHSATGPKNVTLRSSVDGFASDIGSVIAMPASISTGNTISISGLTALSTATTFRLYGYGSTAATGTGGFDCSSSVVNVQLNGAVEVLLPVELTFFTAIAKEKNVELKWNTATEVNNFGFEVERKTMNNEQSTMNNWEKIGFVEGNGTTNAPKSYNYADANVRGTLQYRLKQIDRDGQFEYSNVVEATVAEVKAFGLDQNYPNPFNPNTVISYQLPVSGQVMLTVYDMLGKEVASLVNETKEAGSYTAKFNGSKLSSGIYFYTLRSGNFIATKKLTLMK